MMWKKYRTITKTNTAAMIRTANWTSWLDVMLDKFVIADIVQDSVQHNHNPNLRGIFSYAVR